MEFQEYFPQGTDFHQYSVKRLDTIAVCRVSDEGINVLAQRYKIRISYLFAELNIKILPNYCYVFYPKDRIFTFSLLGTKQKSVLINTSNFYDQSQSPIALSNYITDGFLRSINLCALLFKEVVKYLGEHPINFEHINNVINNYSRGLRYYFKKVTLDDDLYTLIDEIQELNKVLSKGVDEVLLSALQAFILISLGRDWRIPYKFHDFRIVSRGIHLGPLLIVPKGDTSILLLKIREAERSSTEFKFFEPFYQLTQKFYEILKDPNAALTKFSADRSAFKPSCPICNNTGVCHKCGGIGEIVGEKDDLILCPYCKGRGSCICERT